MKFYRTNETGDLTEEQVAKMEHDRKSFLGRLQNLQGELRAITQCSELRWLLQNDHYDPEMTIIDAVHAVDELIEAYEPNALSFQLVAGEALEATEFDRIFDRLRSQGLSGDPEN